MEKRTRKQYTFRRKRIDSKDIAKLLNLNESTIKTWLCRPEFAKYAIKDSFFGKCKLTYIYDEVFKLNFYTFLKLKGYFRLATRFLNNVGRIIKVEK